MTPLDYAGAAAIWCAAIGILIYLHRRNRHDKQ